MSKQFRVFALLFVIAAAISTTAIVSFWSKPPAPSSPMGHPPLGLVEGSAGTATPENPGPLAASDPIVLAGGDTRSGCDEGSFATLLLLDRYPDSVPILHNGDFTNSGSGSEYGDCYSQTWGKHKQQTRPVPGNHEYNTRGAAGYFDYFGSLATPLGQSYYSFEVSSWHIVALNSEIDISADSAQIAWLESDLASHPTRCALVYWHEPRFSSGEHGNDKRVGSLWQVLYEHGVDLVVNGHDHDYERFAPQDPFGALDETRGIQEFVVGTGGVEERSFGRAQDNSLVRNDDTWGILQLTLRSDSYDWQFVPVAGKTFSDSGTAVCH